MSISGTIMSKIFGASKTPAAPASASGSTSAAASAPPAPAPGGPCVQGQRIHADGTTVPVRSAPTPPPNGPCTASPSAGDAGGHGAAVVTTPIEACESNDADPPAWRAHILAKPRDRPENRRDEWPPWNWTPRQQAIAEVA